MKRFIILIIIGIVGLLACNSTQRIDRKFQKLEIKHPERFKEKVLIDTFVEPDTVTVITDTTILQELVITPAVPIENFKVETENGKVSTEVTRTERETVAEYEVITVVMPDTIEVVVRDTVIEKTIQKEIITKTIDKIPNWLKIVSIGLIGLLLAAIGVIVYLFLNNKKKKEKVNDFTL